MPALPGIYIFKNDQNMPIYIGKAKILKKRVSSYFVAKKSDWKTKLLLTHATDLEHIVTKTETEALLLEAGLIKQHQPMFNTLLKDGQPFVYLMISKQELPQLKIVRNKKIKGTYFGPFIYKGQARSVYRFLLEQLQLYVCNKKIENGCLQYHLGKCSGTCKTNFDRAAYLFRLSLAKHILKGDDKSFKKQLAEQIKTHSKQLEFEAAQKLAKIQESLDKIIEIIKLKLDKEPALGGSMLRYALLRSEATKGTQHERNNKILHPLTPKSARTELVEVLQAQTDTSKQPQTKLATFLKLSREPRVIDCFDISHMQGQAHVGACVRFIDGAPAKSQFRHFNIKTVHQPDDYAALQEIVTRRYRDPKNLPDLIMIDGGKGQLSAVQKVLKAPVPIVSLAKNGEKLYSTSTTEVPRLTAADSTGKILIALRDYAHHFAIEHHRRKQNKIKE